MTKKQINLAITHLREEANRFLERTDENGNTPNSFSYFDMKDIMQDIFNSLYELESIPDIEIKINIKK